MECLKCGEQYHLRDKLDHAFWADIASAWTCLDHVYWCTVAADSAPATDCNCGYGMLHQAIADYVGGKYD